MFGMSLSEIIIIAVVAVIFLGPDKLPDAMVKIAKFFKMFKQTINSAKSTFEQEVKIAELKEDAKKYKESVQNATNAVRKKLTFEELDELKSSISETKNSVNESLENIKNDIKNPLNSLNSGDILKDEIEQKPAQTTLNLENKKEA
ncbi:Sec-independent protein translocase protein TatB [Campylobacter hyointestinalis]|uniref:Sec-independent protein translocase protein TatB homolog n=1 Tax=Campylobacter hyointestinalis subsp. lawsonii TaxID=91353 RepID=A0AAV6EHW3_CAMHY|nr:Sec-independent protein translocase protein TatB [Campylobacter hyointestinalis]ANE34036.1 twin arginine translocation system, TatB family protein [Campylobacter hyointestinalis subsp. lawsonii CCUG 27631]KAB0614045.1 Sec-independent protein translocase subunit TatB [Campylobacter hyointestinalis subsp. lawsonii]QKF69779.1 twin arginine translocation system, TatB protein [Campylobacter hyointestinalis subsp. lawsonii]RAZ28172.1 Sec-independent protein translocase subunit TatB [Campylobacter 